MRTIATVAAVAFSILAWGAESRPMLIPAPQKVIAGEGTVSTNAPVACVTDASVKKEGYVLTIAKDGITISSSDAAGAFYARQTLRQLVRPDGTYPCVTVADAPAYAWRGYLLDCSRHFRDVATVKRVLDWMAEYKFNVFHWHLVDDQGWRFPTKKYPLLKTLGATRPRPDWVGPGVYDDATGDYGPFGYSEEEIRDIVAYAAARHIKVMPEMEIPGHSREVVVAYPEFYCENADEKAYTNMNNIGLCLGNDATIQFFKDCLDEYCDLFPDADVIHIGGDECPRENWKKCPKCQKRMKDLGLKSEDELQAWCTRIMTEHLAKRGRKAIGWNEIVDGGLASNTLVMCWNENARAAANLAIRQGNDVVMTPQEKCYFNMPKEGPRNYVPPSEKALRWAYHFDPCFKLDTNRLHHVLGGECCTWGERVIDMKDIEWAVFPLFFAASEALWTGPNKPGLKDFVPRAEEHNRRLREQGHNVAPVPQAPSVGETGGRIDLAGVFPPEVKCVYLVAPCSFPKAANVMAVTNALSRAGYRVKVSRSVWTETRNAAEKARDFEMAWKDPSADLILCACGGRGCAQTVANLNFDVLRSRDLPVVGFSNASCLLNAFVAKGVSHPISGPMGSTMASYPHTRDSLERLSATVAGAPLPPTQLTVLRPGKGTLTGKAIGGHWGSLSRLSRDFLPSTDGRIVFIEIDVYSLANAKRCFLELKRKGYFKSPAAVVICELGIPGAPASHEEMKRFILEAVDCPVYAGYPYGHVPKCYAIDFARTAQITPTGELRWR